MAINLLTLNSYADEIKFYYNTSGNISVKNWISNDTVTQFAVQKLSAEEQLTAKPQSQTTIGKTSTHYLELNSNYWFGLVSQNNLFNLGPLFGIGFDFLFSSTSFSNSSIPQSSQEFLLNANSYFMDISFIKLALLHDEKMSKYISLSGHYTNFSNYALSKLSTLDGLALGVEGKYNLFDVADLHLNANYIPVITNANLNKSFGINADTGIKWNISPKASIDVGYKALYYAGSADVEVNAKDTAGKDVVIKGNLTLSDLIHGLTFGGTYYF